MNSSTRDIFLKDLLDTYDLSVRAYNVCDNLGLNTIRDLHNFLLRFKSFKRLRNCGSKTESELLLLHKRLYLNSSESSQDQNTYSETINSEINDESFEILIKEEFNKLSVRAKNALLTYFNNVYPTKYLVKAYFIDHPLKPEKLRNVGAKTVIEIEEFVKASISFLVNSGDDEVREERLITLKIKEITGVNINDNSFVEKFVCKEFPIITFAAKYLNELACLDSLGGYVIKNHFYLLEEQYTLDEIGKRFKLTRERVRQKREACLDKIPEKLIRLRELLDFSKYNNIFDHESIIELPQGIKENFIFDEIEIFGEQFSLFILENLFKDGYYSISPYDNIVRPNKVSSLERYNALKRIRGCYLVNKNIISKEEFIGIYEFLLDKICQRQEQDIVVEFSDLIKNSITPEISEMLTFFLTRELQLSIENSKIYIPRNSLKLTYEYAKEALEKLGKPAHITEIYATIKELNPSYDGSDVGLKASITKQRDTFIYFGRSSTFGLKKWEEKYKTIKGGTIRDIVEEFLNGFNEPCHISAITQYVNNFRKTEDHSIINNLKMTEKKRFTFFKDGYVGLASKNYNKLKNKIKLEQVSLDDLMESIFTKQ